MNPLAAFASCRRAHKGRDPLVVERHSFGQQRFRIKRHLERKWIGLNEVGRLVDPPANRPEEWPVFEDPDCSNSYRWRRAQRNRSLYQIDPHDQVSPIPALVVPASD